MLDFLSKEIKRGFQLLSDGKVEEALQLVTDLEKHDDFRSKDKDFLHFLKGGVLYFLGRLPESLILAEQEYPEGKRLKKHLYSIDMVFLKFANFVLLNRVSEVWEDVDFCETLLKSELHETPSEINLRKGFVYMMRGYYFWYENNYDKALKHLKQSLAILENFFFRVAFYLGSTRNYIHN
jgi:tetratricopeptide (TPR) repeat protein